MYYIFLLDRVLNILSFIFLDDLKLKFGQIDSILSSRKSRRRKPGLMLFKFEE